jgi:hypothetical protein
MNPMRYNLFVLVTIIATVIIMAVPLFVGLLSTPADMVFSGRTDQNSGDYGIYFSQMEQARQGHLLFRNLYTSEVHPYVIFNPLWLALGNISRFFNLPNALTFHLARLVLIPFFILAAWLLICYIFSDTFVRKVALLLVIFAGGIMGYSDTTDASVFNSLLFSPHLVLSLTMILVIFLLLLKSFDERKLRPAVLAGVCGLFLFLIHPYHISTIYIIIGLFIAVRLAQKKLEVKRVIAPLLLFTFISLPAILYYYWLFYGRLSFGELWLSQTNTLMKVRTPWEIMFSYLPLLTIAITGLILMRRNRVPQFPFILTWILAPLIFMSLPVFFRMRMSGGLSIALALAAAYGIGWLWRAWLKKRAYLMAFFVSAVIILVCSTHIITYYKNILVYTHPQPLVYLPEEMMTAMAWYEKNTSGSDVLLASYQIGNIFPAFTGRTVYAGHGIQTMQITDKIIAIQTFFDEAATDQSRVDFLKTNSISYIYYSSFEKSLGSFDPASASFLDEAYHNKNFQLYKVVNI